jgi:hypothetical protein
MSASFVQFSGSDRKNGAQYPPMQRASTSKIHTIHDWQQSDVEEANELEELLEQTKLLMSSAKEAVEKYSNSVASNGARLRNITRRTQIQADGQAELASKIESAERNTAETRRQVFDAKRAGWNAVVSAGTFGITAALRTMPGSFRAEQQAPHASGRSSSSSELPPSSDVQARDRLPNNYPPLRQRADRVLASGESSPPGWPPRNEAEWDRLVSAAEKQNGGNGGAISPWIPINPVSNTSSRPVPAATSVGGLVLCGYGDPESNVSNDPSTPEWGRDREYERDPFYNDVPIDDWRNHPLAAQAEWEKHVANVYTQGFQDHFDEGYSNLLQGRVFQSMDEMRAAFTDAHTAFQREREVAYLEAQIWRECLNEQEALKK